MQLNHILRKRRKFSQSQPAEIEHSVDTIENAFLGDAHRVHREIAMGRCGLVIIYYIFFNKIINFILFLDGQTRLLNNIIYVDEDAEDADTTGAR